MAELTTLARPYAKAAFLFAREQNALDKWESMLGLAAALIEDATMAEALDRPALSVDQSGRTRTLRFVRSKACSRCVPNWKCLPTYAPYRSWTNWLVHHR